MKPTSVLAAALCLGLIGCAGRGERPKSSLPTTWRAKATDADRERLRGWRDAWLAAVAEARAAGLGAELDGLGPLLDLDRALPRPLPPAGDYRCRTIKLGRQTNAPLAYAAYPFVDCRIDNEGKVHSLHQRTGSQRPVGLIFPDTEGRAIFLGTLVLGDETSPLRYGADAKRDMAGIVERVGERRWRVALPAPAFESKLDIIELVPAA